MLGGRDSAGPQVTGQGFDKIRAERPRAKRLATAPPAGLPLDDWRIARTD